MDSLIFSINAVLPIFVIMVAGYIITHATDLLDKTTAAKMNALVFNYALPVMLFRDIASSDFKQLFDLKLALYAVGTTVFIFIAAWAIAGVFVKDKQQIGVFVQGSFRSNYAIIGLPLISNVLAGASTGKGALITTFVIPIYNVLSVVVLSIYSGKNENGSKVIKSALINIYKNPLIRGIVLGIPFSILGIKLPGAAASSINYMANLATPLALLAIGAGINVDKMKAKFIPALIVSTIKLVVCPLVFIPIAFIIGMRGESLIILYIMYASPTAVSSYIMAVNMGGDEYLASNIVLLTTLLSVFTFTIGIFIFKVCGLI